MHINPYEASYADIPESKSNPARWVILGLLGLFLVAMLLPAMQGPRESGSYRSSWTLNPSNAVEEPRAHPCDYSTKEEVSEEAPTE